METYIYLILVLTTGTTFLVLFGGIAIFKSIVDFKEHLLSLGRHVIEANRHTTLKADYFDGEAKLMQGFLERFLGKEFNVQCAFIKQENRYVLWIWKRYETRDMGCTVADFSPSGLVCEFMRVYYTNGYFTDAMAFPDKE